MTNDPSGQGYPGQMGASDGATEFNKHYAQIWGVLAKVRTSVPVKIIAVHVDAGGLAPVGFVDAQPAVNQMDGGGKTFPHDTVFNLPYVRMQGGANAVICDPVVGDVGMAMICDRDISSVKANKGIANPGSRRRFGLADGVYVGGILNGTPTQYFWFTADGIKIVDKSGNSFVMTADGTTLTDAAGNVISTTAAGIAMTPKAGLPVTVNGVLIVKQALQLEGGILNEAGGTYAGDIKTAGNVVAGFGSGDSVGLQTHTHTQPPDGHGDAEQPTAAPTGGT